MMMKRDVVQVSAAIIGGLGIGAIAMYLFDPDKGLPRRKWLGKQARGMVDQAGQAVHQTGQSMRRGTRRLRERAGAMMPFGMIASSPAISQETCPVARSVARASAPLVGAMLGAGLMFMLDPVSGRRRRALVRDKAVHYSRQAEHKLFSTGRHLSNRAIGAYHGASSMFSRHQHNGGHDSGMMAEHGAQL